MMDTLFDVARFEASLPIQRLSKSNRDSVMKVARSIARGDSIVYKDRVFPGLKDKRVTHRCLLEDGLHAAVKSWCPRASAVRKKKESANEEGEGFLDTSNGWCTDDPVNRMIKFVRWEIQPDAEREVAENMMRCRRMQPLDVRQVGQKRNRRSWNVRAHVRENREERMVTAPFLDSFCKRSSTVLHGDAWVYDTEYTFGDRTRSDILLHNLRTNTFVIVESKQNNALHALGQLFHYHDMALGSVPGYASGRKIHVAAVMSEPSRFVFETVSSRGVIVWWPGNDDVLDACFSEQEDATTIG